MDIKTLQADPAVISGRWVKDIPGLPGVSLKVRGLSAPQFRNLRNRLFRNLPDSDRNPDGTVSDEAYDRIMGEGYAGAVLLDWRGLTNGGEEFAYDADTAWLWLTDPVFGKFSDAVTWAASRVDAGDAQYFEAVEKN